MCMECHERWATNGLGRPKTVERGVHWARLTFDATEWVAGVWESMEGGRFTTADAPERFAMLAKVDFEARALEFIGDVTMLHVGGPLYFWAPQSPGLTGPPPAA